MVLNEVGKAIYRDVQTTIKSASVITPSVIYSILRDQAWCVFLETAWTDMQCLQKSINNFMAIIEAIIRISLKYKQ